MKHYHPYFIRSSKTPIREEMRWLRHSEMAPAIFLLAAKDFSEQNTPNNKFHGI